MPDNYDIKRFEQESVQSCADGNCGRSVIINNNDNDGDCCIPGPAGPAGPAGKTGPAGPAGKDGPKGRPPLIRCGCLATNEQDGGSGGPIQQECIDNITGRVVMSASGSNINYFTQNTTSNTFSQDNCFPGGGGTCGYFNVTNPNLANPKLGDSTGSLGQTSTIITGDKYIVAWGYIGTGNVPNVNYTWKYGDFKKINGLAADKLSATQGAKFTFMPTDSLFTGNGQIDLGGWKSLITGNPAPSEDLIAAFLNDFPQCATDGTGTPPGPKNGQGLDICKNAGGECACEGCTADNQLQNCDDIAAGDVFIDACNKIMYIAGESGAFPANGIPFGPEDTPCPPKEECPNCPDCPPPNCASCPCTCETVQPPLPFVVCNCAKTISNLLGSDCTCASFPGNAPKCPQQCASDPKSFWYQDATKECPCGKDQTYLGCVDCKEPKVICDCKEGTTAGCCETCKETTCEKLGCPIACPPAADGTCNLSCSEIAGVYASAGCTECLCDCAICCPGSTLSPLFLLGE